MDERTHWKIKQALRDFVPWDLRDRLDCPLDAMATAAYGVVREILDSRQLEYFEAKLRGEIDGD